MSQQHTRCASVAQQTYEPAAQFGTLVPHPDNPNAGDVELIQESIQENSFYGAVVAQASTRRILIGHHRVKAAEREGLTAGPVIFVDCDDETALRILLADNVTAAAAVRSVPGVAAILSRLRVTRGTGYRGTDIQGILARILPERAPAGDAAQSGTPVPPTSEEEERDGDDNGPESEPRPVPPPPAPPDRHALAIVLSNAQKRRWDAVRGRRTDKEAFLALIGAAVE